MISSRILDYLKLFIKSKNLPKTPLSAWFGQSLLRCRDRDPIDIRLIYAEDFFKLLLSN